MKKLLITGGSGDLGRILSQRALVAGYEVTVTYLTRPERITAGKALKLDLCDKQAVQTALDTLQPEIIIHTALSLTVANPRQQIVSAAYHLSKLADKSTRLIFLSTDMVFDGMRPPYRDDDPPSPTTAYGQAKAEMEMMADHVVRTSLIYDFAAGNRQIDWMLEKIGKGERCRLYGNEFRSAIWVVNLADALLEMVNGKIKGILNVAGPKPMNRLELGRSLLKVLGYDPDQHTESAQAGPERQPNLTLDVSKAQMSLKTPLLTFEEALQRWQANSQAKA